MAQEDIGGLVRHVRKRWGALKRERSQWMTVWEDISRYMAPDMGRFTNTAAGDRGARRDKAILDNSATRAMRTLAAGLHAGLSSPSQPWLELTASDPKLRDSPAVKAWLSKVRDLLLAVFAKSNTYRAIHGMYEELATFGTAAAVIAADFDNVVHLHALTVGSYAIATDSRGVVNTLYRQFSMTVDRMVGMFGIDHVSSHVRDLYVGGNLDQEFEVIHAIEPRPNGGRPRMGALGAAWMEVYFEDGRQDAKPLRESGYEKFPAIVPRWIVSGENVYGTSPGRDALGDIKQLQHAQLRKAQAIDYQTKPPVQGPASLKGNNSALLPGGYSQIDAAGPQGGMRTVFEVSLDLQHLVGDIQDTRQRISQTFYEDVFRMVSDLDRSGITARQIAEQHSEKMMLMGPVIERVQHECLSPLVEMAFDLLAKAGILPEPPPEIQDEQQITVEFISILAQAQKQAGASAVDRWLATVASLAPMLPEALDKIDVDAVIDDYAQTLSINPKMVRDGEPLEAIRMARAQQQQQQQQADEQSQQASVAKDMSSVQPQGGGGGGSVAKQLDIARLLGG